MWPLPHLADTGIRQANFDVVYDSEARGACPAADLSCKMTRLRTVSACARKTPELQDDGYD